ncbi:flippase [Patescibacteria group bacterium]|nr:flippase [Patescibacteria group bacterium]
MAKIIEVIKAFLFRNRTTKQTVVKNTLWLAISEAIVKFLTFVLTAIIARYLGVSSYGDFAFAFVVVSLFASLVDFGFNDLLTRELARNQKEVPRLVGAVIVIKLFLSLIVVGFILIITRLVVPTVETRLLVYIAVPWMLVQSFTQLVWSVLRAFERMELEAVSKSIYNFALLLFVIAVIAAGLNSSFIILSYVIAISFGLIVTLLVMRRVTSNFRIICDSHAFKTMLSQVWPFALSGIAIAVYYRIGTVILNYYHPGKAVGYFSAANNILLMVITVIGLFASALLPTLSQLYNKSLRRFRNATTNLFKLVLLFSFPLCLLIFLNSAAIISLVYGNEYIRDAATALKISIWSAYILYNYAIFSVGLTASDHQKTYLRGVGMGALVNIAANLMLVPHFSYQGVVVARFVTEIIIGIYICWHFHKYTKIKLPIIFILKNAAAVSTVTLFVFVFRKADPLFLSFFNLVVYFGIVSLTGIFHDKLWTEIVAVIPLKRKSL